VKTSQSERTPTKNFQIDVSQLLYG